MSSGGQCDFHQCLFLLLINNFDSNPQMFENVFISICTRKLSICFLGFKNVTDQSASDLEK